MAQSSRARGKSRGVSNQSVIGPWWMSGGEQECSHCGQRYAYEAEVRCAQCDDAMCAVCVAWVERAAHCPGCTP